MFGKRLLLVVWIVITSLAGAGSLSAQQEPAAATDLGSILSDVKAGAAVVNGGEAGGQPSAPGFTEAEYRRLQETNKRFWITIVAILTPVVLAMVLVFLKLSKAAETTVMHAAGLVLVVFATIFIVVVANTQEQMTAAIGIIGAVAGYLFGRATATREATPSSSK